MDMCKLHGSGCAYRELKDDKKSWKQRKVSGFGSRL
ncbi:hypothetical protein ACP4OV_007044 [Aristida adscensionis]